MKDRLDIGLKKEATKKANWEVFENLCSPKDIVCSCSDGIWIRKLWKNVCGNFGWGRWEKVS